MNERIEYTEIPNTGGRYYISETGKDVWNNELKREVSKLVLIDNVPRVALFLENQLKFYEVDYLYDLTFGTETESPPDEIYFENFAEFKEKE